MNRAYIRAVNYFNNQQSYDELGTEAVHFALRENEKWRDHEARFVLNIEKMTLISGNQIYYIRLLPSLQHWRALFDLARIHCSGYATIYDFLNISGKLTTAAR